MLIKLIETMSVGVYLGLYQRRPLKQPLQILFLKPNWQTIFFYLCQGSILQALKCSCIKNWKKRNEMIKITTMMMMMMMMMIDMTTIMMKTLFPIETWQDPDEVSSSPHDRVLCPQWCLKKKNGCCFMVVMMIFTIIMMTIVMTTISLMSPGIPEIPIILSIL